MQASPFRLPILPPPDSRTKFPPMAQPYAALQPEAAPQWWRIGRLSIGFLLDTFSLSRGGADIIDPLLLTVILEASVAPVSQDSALSVRYAALDDPPPDELRRPVSINAVAASLRLPYETVRRRVSRLVDNGAASVTPKGVVIRAATVDNPFFRIAATAHYERTKRFYFELKSLGALPAVTVHPADAPRYEAPPVRLVNRLLSEYALRMIDSLMKRVGDPVTALILLELGRANLEHLTPDQVAHEGPLPDAQRLPIRTLTLAKRVGLPPETVRRHVAALLKLEYCRKVQGGCLAALEQLGRGGDGTHGVFDNFANLQRMFARATALGVTAYWEEAARAAQEAETAGRPTRP